MPFPEVDRAVFGISPLTEVICQIRFPVILAIDAKEPFEFQELIRDIFPVYETTIEQQQQFTFENPMQVAFGQAPNVLPQPLIRMNANKNYKFTSKDGNWWINLTRSFLSLSTFAYDRWESFRDHFTRPLEAFMNFYRPSFIERVGLRYIDVFCRSELALHDVSWAELFYPHAIGILASSEDVSKKVGSFQMINEITLNDNISMCRINSSLVVKQGEAQGNPSTEKCLMIDGDFYNAERTIDVACIREKMEYLHTRSTRMIRWMMKDRLYVAMEPTKI